jgi:hypothetical protein
VALEPGAGTGNGGANSQNFLDCVKSRQQPNAPVEVGASAVSAPHLANVAFHGDRRAHLSADGSKVS